MIHLLGILALTLAIWLGAPVAILLGQWVQQPSPSPTNENLWSVRFVNESIGWVLGGEGNIYKTTDSGATWVTQETWQGGGWALHALSEDIALYARWMISSSNSDHIRKTSDGGSTWQTVDSLGSHSVWYDDFEFIDSVNGFFVGGIDLDPGLREAMVGKTTDGGSTWATLWTEDVGSELTGISFIDEMEGWASTYWNKIFHTTDGGNTWTEVTTYAPPHTPTRDVQFTTSDSGWAVGGISGDLTVSRTTDGGLSWSYLTPGGSSLREIKMLNSHLGWFVGSVNFEPYVARTTNGGETWETQTTIPPTNIGFESISMVSATTGWAVGHWGQLYKTTNGGVVAVDEEPSDGIPSSFVLRQNYPNPFNPVTAIRYSVPMQTAVNMQIFDVLGRLVETLVSGEMEPGRYDVTFDGTNHPSGVYYVVLKGGGFKKVTKAVLLR
jgi:photosystem II stability/assembly factor-like uncharacterized protein